MPNTLPHRDAHKEVGIAGFALLEVIVALAILSFALSVLLNSIGTGLRNTSQAERAAEAASLAQSLLTEIGTERPIKEGQSKGDFANGYQWRLSIQEFGDRAEQQAWPVGAYTIAAEVIWKEGARQQSFTLTTLRLGLKGSAQ